MLVTMHDEVLRVCEAVRAAGGRAMLVGGWVRDRLLGHDSKDYDLEVYAVEPEALRAILKTFGRVNTVGEHFAVYKLVCAASGERLEIDVSIPRRESKSGRGHRGFTIEGDPRMSFEEAARRRDFTINAILYDPLTKEFIDPYGGINDLRQKRLRAVAAETFVEDSLRVLRAVQFAARFEMTVGRETAALCRTIDLADLPHERVWGEVEKLLLMSARPAIGLDVALELGVLDKLFPELRALVGSHLEEQTATASADESFEDDFTHTKRAFDHAARLTEDLDRPRRVTVMLATLCHVPGESAALAVMRRLGLYTLLGYNVRAEALALLREQTRPAEFYARREQATDGDLRRLARHVEIDLLYRLVKACALAHVTAAEPAGQAADWFIERARRLGVEHGPPAPLLLGRHLIEMGVAPGPAMGRQLRDVYELQLDGEVTTLDEARAAARRLLDAG